MSIKNKLFLAFLILFSNISFSQKKLKDSIFIKNDIYEIIYSEVLQQPRNVKYTVYCPLGSTEHYSRKGLNFYKPDNIVTSDDNDYKKNDYDKGHLVPAADFNCNFVKLSKTFSYLNCALQNKFLNRGTWEKLETYERKLARTHIVKVEVIIGFSSKSKRVQPGATIPDYFIKIIRYDKVTEKYYFKNERPQFTSYLKYKIK